MKKKILLIVPDKLSDFLEKGEITKRYYNPGNLFDEVHIMMTNDDQPDQDPIQKMAGRAKLFIHNYPQPHNFFRKTLGWNLSLIKRWGENVLEKVREINPNIMRCHGAHLNAYLASTIKDRLGIPYIVSLHINPDENFRKSAKTMKDKVIFHCLKKIEKIALSKADLVTPVYEPIVPYLKKMGIEHYKVCYNVLNDQNLIPKENYEIGDVINIASIGRQIPEKNPSQLIKAIAKFRNVHLSLVGNGPIHEELKSLVRQQNLEDRVHFRTSINNDELCNSLSSYDLMALHTDYFELSKVMIESFLVGLPLLLNHRSGLPVPELSDNICLRVNNSVEGYYHGLKKLIDDPNFRAALGQNAYKMAQEKLKPSLCEQAYVDIYKELMIP